MLSRWSSLLRPAVLTMATLVLSVSSARSGHGQAPAPGTESAGYGQGGTKTPSANLANGRAASTSTAMSASSASGGCVPPCSFEVVWPGGCYCGGIHQFGRRGYLSGGYGGFFKRYYGYGYYGPNINLGPVSSQCGGTAFVYAAARPGHGLSKHGHEAVSAAPCDLGGILPGGGMNPPSQPANEPGRAPAEKVPPPTPNAAHLQLLVPEKAEVLVEGVKTRTTGAVRDFISPPLAPGRNMTYTVAVRYTDGDGKPVEATHSVRVRANDRLRIDCTRPTNIEQVRAAALK